MYFSPKTIQSEIWTINTDTNTRSVIRWNKMGPEFTYMLFYAKSPNGPWIRHNEIRLTDDIIDLLRDVVAGEDYTTLDYNEYYMTGLDINTNYSVKITCLDRYDSWWYSQDSYDSLSGGLSASHTRPSPDGGNVLSFQCYVTGG